MEPAARLRGLAKGLFPSASWRLSGGYARSDLSARQAGGDNTREGLDAGFDLGLDG